MELRKFRTRGLKADADVFGHVEWAAQAIEKLLHRIAALPPATPAEGWRDISTAPKDGTRVLLGGKKEWIAIGNYLEGFGWQDSTDGASVRPSYWMPLAPPPSGTKDAG